MRTASNSLPCVRAFARVLLATVVVGLGLAAASLLRPASTEAADPIWACYSNSNFSLRTVAGPSACAGGETAVRLDDSENPIWICLHPQPGHIRFAGPADADPITGNCWGAGSTQYFQAPGENAVTLCVQPSNGILSYPPCGPNQTQLVIPPRQRAPVAADQSVSTNEDTPKVITLSATDADDDNLTFSIVDQPAHGTLGSLGAPDCSAANVCTATVTYTPDTDYFGSDSFTFNANDGDADSNVATVSITINPVNDAPTDIALDNASVPENQPGGTLVGTFSTTDADPGDTFTYTLVGGAGSDDNGDFQIAGNQLVTDHGLNFEADPERTIRVRSTDAGGLFTEQQFTITVTDVNEAPTAIAIDDTEIGENREVGTAVGILSTTDPDAGDTFTYSLVTGAGDTDNASFQIDGDRLESAVVFDFETKSSYTVRVRSTDSGGLFTEQQFTISVVDLNDDPTDIALSNNTIDENVPANTVVGTFSTADQDVGDTFTYSLVAGAGDTDNGAFTIGGSGSDLRITNSPNFEAQSSYSIRARTDDGNGGTFEKVFTITVTDLNEAPTAGTDTYDAIGNTQLRINSPTSPTTSVAFTTSGTSPLANDTDPDTNPAFNALQISAVGTCSKGGTLTLNAADHTDGRLTYLPPQGIESANAADTDDCTYTLSDGTNSVGGTIKVKITDMVWYVDNTAAAGGDGRSTAVYNSLTPLNGAGGSGDEDDADDYIFVFQGSGSYTGGLVLETGQRLFGQPNGLTVGATTLIAGSGSNPTLTNGAGAGITLANGVDVERIDVANTSGAGIVGTGVTSATMGGNTSITNTGGNGFDLSGAAGGTVSVGASISNTGGKQVSIQNRTSGTVTLSGTISGTGTGVLLSGNANTTNFTGTLTLSTGTNPAFTATNPSLQGTFSVDPVGTNNNTLSTTTGTALTVTNTNLSANGIEFRSISADGAASGIVLNNTGTSGGLTVTGTGAANSGGTIQNTTSHGISLDSTSNVSLTSMNIQSTGDSGVNGTQVTNFSFINGTINNSGDANFESNIAFNGNGALTGSNITGTLTVTGSTLTNAYYSGIDLQSNGGTLANATVTGNTITSSTSDATSKGYGVNLVGTGTAATVFNLTNATISNNVIRNFPSGGGIQVNMGNASASGPGATAGTPGTASVVSITGNSIRGESAANTMGTSAILVANSGGNSGSRSVMNVEVLNNGSSGDRLAFMDGTTIAVGNNGYATMTATVTNNWIDSHNIFASQGIGGGNGVVLGGETPDLTMTVSSNTILNTDGNGILLVGRGTAGTARLKINGNTVAAPLGGARQGIRVDAGNAASTDDAVYLNIFDNTSAGSGGAVGIGVRKQGTVSTVNDFGIFDAAGGPTLNDPPSNTDVETFIGALNPAGGGAVVIAGDNFQRDTTQAPA